MNQNNLLELLYKAYNSPIGIVIRTNEVERLRQKLYVERKKDPDLACLSFAVSRTNPETEIWIVKKHDPKNSPAETYDAPS